MQRVYVTNMGAGMGWGGRIMAILGGVLAVAAAIAFVMLSIGIALILLPVVAVAGVIGWWRWRKVAAEFQRQAAEQRAAAPAGRVIDAEYEIIGPDGTRRD